MRMHSILCTPAAGAFIGFSSTFTRLCLHLRSARARSMHALFPSSPAPLAAQPARVLLFFRDLCVALFSERATARKKKKEKQQSAHEREHYVFGGSAAFQHTPASPNGPKVTPCTHVIDDSSTLFVLPVNCFLLIVINIGVMHSTCARSRTSDSSAASRRLSLSHEKRRKRRQRREGRKVHLPQNVPLGNMKSFSHFILISFLSPLVVGRKASLRANTLRNYKLLFGREKIFEDYVCYVCGSEPLIIIIGTKEKRFSFRKTKFIIATAEAEKSPITFHFGRRNTLRHTHRQLLFGPPSAEACVSAIRTERL